MNDFITSLQRKATDATTDITLSCLPEVTLEVVIPSPKVMDDLQRKAAKRGKLNALKLHRITARTVVKGWTGLTVKAAMRILPNFEMITELDPGKEILFSPEMLKFLAESSLEFGQELSMAISDATRREDAIEEAQELAKDQAAAEKNSSSSAVPGSGASSSASESSKRSGGQTPGS